MGGLREGLLGGLVGAGSGMADVGKRQSEYRMEQLKSNTLASRETNLANLRINAQKEAVALARTNQETDRTRLEQSALEPYRALALKNNPDATPEELELEAGKLKGEHQVSQLTAGKAPGAEMSTAALKEASKIFEGLDDDQRGKLLMANKGDIPAAIRSIANTLAPGSRGFQGSVSDKQSNINKTKEMERIDNAITATTAEIEGLDKKGLKQYIKDRPGLPKEVVQVIEAKIETSDSKPGYQQIGDVLEGVGSAAYNFTPAGAAKKAVGILGKGKNWLMEGEYK